MALVADTDRIILMDVGTCEGKYMNCDDLKMLHDAGMRTVFPLGVDWGNIEKSMGEYDWSLVDHYVESRLDAGFNILLGCYSRAPTCLPDEWYAHTGAGIARGLISPWNVEAQAYMLEFYKRVMKRYESSNVVVVNTYLTEGETIGLNEPMWFDPFALASFREYDNSDKMPCKNSENTEAWLLRSYMSVLNSQAQVLLSGQHRELWTMLHPAIADMGGLYGNGCKWIEPLLSMYRSFGDDVYIGHIMFTWRQWAYYWPRMNKLSEQYGAHLFGGAEYADGAPMSATLAKEQGIAGLICGPTHPFTGHKHVLPWMVENIKQALSRWQ